MHLFMISLLLVQAVPTPSALYERYNQITRFDHHFSKYSKRYFGPAIDWRYFKAQAVAESRLEENATSAAGAVGALESPIVRTFTFEVIADGFPFFVKSLHSTWTVQALGAKRSEVTIHSQFEMLPVIGALMWPLFKKNSRETTTTLLEELKHYAETGETGRLTHQAKDPGQLG